MSESNTLCQVRPWGERQLSTVWPLTTGPCPYSKILWASSAPVCYSPRENKDQQCLEFASPLSQTLNLIHCGLTPPASLELTFSPHCGCLCRELSSSPSGARKLARFSLTKCSTWLPSEVDVKTWAPSSHWWVISQTLQRHHDELMSS